MKFTTSTLFFAIFATAKAAEVQDRALATLADQWSIADPTFAIDGLAFTFDYPVSNFIDQTQAYYEVYDAGCKEGANLVATGVTSSALVDVTAGSVTDDGSFDIVGKTAQVPIAINPGTIVSNTDVYTETNTDGSITASIVFCVRFGLKTTGASPVEVNFLESVVTLSVDLSSGFAVDAVNVTPKDKLLNTAAQVYTVEGYMCDPGTDTPVADASTALTQGSLITICVKPTADGITDGIKMRTIDSFEWTRLATSQAAIESGAAASNLLTNFDDGACVGGDYCQFSSILFAAFYATEGTVAGSGVSSMQFGPGRRALREGQPRALQEAAATSEFDMSVPIQAATDGPGATYQTAAGATASTMFAGALALISAVAML